MDYWERCIKEAFEETGITATEAQTQIVIYWVEGAHENHSRATGQYVISRNYISDEAREPKSVKAVGSK